MYLEKFNFASKFWNIFYLSVSFILSSKYMQIYFIFVISVIYHNSRESTFKLCIFSRYKYWKKIKLKRPRSGNNLKTVLLDCNKSIIDFPNKKLENRLLTSCNPVRQFKEAVAFSLNQYFVTVKYCRISYFVMDQTVENHNTIIWMPYKFCYNVSIGNYMKNFVFINLFQVM